MKKISFRHWLMTQPLNKLPDGPEGDFVANARDDRRFPDPQTWREVRSYLNENSACSEAIFAAARVWRHYQRSVPARMSRFLNRWSDGRMETPPSRVGSQFGPEWHVLHDRIMRHNTQTRAERLSLTLEQLAANLGVAVTCILAEGITPTASSPRTDFGGNPIRLRQPYRRKAV